MTHPLLEFLTAELLEDERIALAARGAGEFPTYPWGLEDAELEFIQRWDPTVVLADIAAKRQILALFGVAERHLEETRRTAPHYRLVIVAEAPHDILLRAVQYLAAAYSDRDGYQSQWAPT